MYYFIEPMLEDDIQAVQAIEHQSFSTPWSASTYRREIRSPASCRYIVARSSSTPPPPRAEEPPLPRRMPNFLTTLLASLFPRSSPAASAVYPIVGYGGIWLTIDEAHVTTIAVDPPYRGHGIGELLINGLIDQAYDLQAQLLTLEVRLTNTNAQKLYHKYGFQVVGRRTRYYTDNGEDALIMSTDSIQTPTYKETLNDLRRRLYMRLRLGN